MFLKNYYMQKQKTITGLLLILAAFTFLSSWWLMPDPGTVDTIHILQIVKQSRTAVLSSVIIQIISSVLYVLAMLLIVRICYPQKKALAGVALLAIGAMGLCADAFFHLLAWFMTDDSVTIQKDVVKVMDFMQTQGLIFLVPLLIPLFFGGLILAIGLHRQNIISRKSQIVFIIAFVAGVITAIATKLHLQYLQIPILAILALFATGQVLLGIELIKTTKQLHLKYSKNKILIQVNQ
jgi:hypothetical protein